MLLSNNGKNVIDENLNKKLMEKGYAVLKSICINGKCIYLKCISDYGNYVLVLLDNVSLELYNSTNKGFLVVPYSTKIGLLQCLNSSVCGLVFECNSEYCILVQDDFNKFKEYTIIENEDNRGTDDNDNYENDYLVYPVVYFKEIMDDPEKMMALILEKTRIIRTEEYNLYLENKDTLSIICSSILQSIDNFYDYSEEELKNNGNELIKMYPNLKSLTDSQKRNLKNRNDFINNFIRITKTFPTLIFKLNNIRLQIESDKNMIKTMSSQLK